ncbi:gamma-aminobutyric acid type B receptor subunit 2-like [Tachypleus tridentatus]|uniref:gamma-aminobutyric acid type B receptor subunit 2-like n=1 Tax=Tachypleus tridentatus TaxID=6853 RepID=UPI003FD29A84
MQHGILILGDTFENKECVTYCTTPKGVRTDTIQFLVSKAAEKRQDYKDLVIYVELRKFHNTEINSKNKKMITKYEKRQTLSKLYGNEKSSDNRSRYKVKVKWNVSELYLYDCDPAVGMKSFFDMLSDEPRKIVLFGDACTSVTDPIAKAAQFFQIVQLTYGDTHPMYTVENYPNFFQVVPSENAFNSAQVALLQHFNWSRVGTLYQSTPRYALPHSKLLSDLETAKIKIAAQQGFVDELESAISKLKEKDVRIILGKFEEQWAIKVFCEAYKVGLYGKKYQWIIVGVYDYDWWKKHLDIVTCNQSQLGEAMEGYLATDILSLSSTEDITVSGLTSAEYETQYKQRYDGSNNRFHGYAYDGIWMIALAIQMVKRKLIAIDSSRTLEMFEYRDPMWGALFREAFNQTSFRGVTVGVATLCFVLYLNT